jgi:N-dimethylarginine dimethylaminohydrolase
MTKSSTFSSAAYGGEGWQQRNSSHQNDIGNIWGDCGLENEYGALKSVILHSPGAELDASQDKPDSLQMLETVDSGKAGEEHAMLVDSYQSHGINVHLLDRIEPVSPNQMFCADLFAMTPHGAILARPASVVRAGEEVRMARGLVGNNVPILRTLTGNATFEGADMIWINADKVLLGQGLRTNREAAHQIGGVLGETGVELIPVDMPYGTMHLMGMVRIVSSRLAIGWPRRTPHRVVTELREAGYQVEFIPEVDDFEHGKAFNFVTLGPGKILTVTGNTAAIRFYESLGIECIETPAIELSKAAGAVGCLTGIIKRE